MKFRVYFFTVYLFIGSLLPNSDLHELSKIPSLLKHYQTHKVRNGGTLAFSTFIKMHYTCASQPQTENHDSLPFKQMGNSPFDYFISYPQLQHPENTLVVEQPERIILTPLFITGQFSGSIWQPPQLG